MSFCAYEGRICRRGTTFGPQVLWFVDQVGIDQSCLSWVRFNAGKQWVKSPDRSESSNNDSASLFIKLSTLMLFRCRLSTPNKSSRLRLLIGP